MSLYFGGLKMKENIKLNQQRYAKRRYNNTGIKARCLYMTDKQLIVVKAFLDVLKKIKNFDELSAIDVSDDLKTFKLLFKDPKNADTEER